MSQHTTKQMLNKLIGSWSLLKAKLMPVQLRVILVLRRDLKLSPIKTMRIALNLFKRSFPLILLLLPACEPMHQDAVSQADCKVFQKENDVLMRDLQDQEKMIDKYLKNHCGILAEQNKALRKMIGACLDVR